MTYPHTYMFYNIYNCVTLLICDLWLIVVPTGLLALQGDDKPGRLIRKSLKELNVLSDFIRSERFFVLNFLKKVISSTNSFD